MLSLYVRIILIDVATIETLRLYDVDAKQLKSTYTFRAPVLDGAFSSDDMKLFGAGVDRSVRQ
jgi:hypothetical protein